MHSRVSIVGSELLIVPNSKPARRVRHDWCEVGPAIDVANACFEIGRCCALRRSGTSWTEPGS
jgi:hypothetical protein